MAATMTSELAATGSASMRLFQTFVAGKVGHALSGGITTAFGVGVGLGVGVAGGVGVGAAALGSGVAVGFGVAETGVGRGLATAAIAVPEGAAEAVPGPDVDWVNAAATPPPRKASAAARAKAARRADWRPSMRPIVAVRRPADQPVDGPWDARTFGGQRPFGLAGAGPGGGGGQPGPSRRPNR